jgi:hypothetical protein
VPDDMAREVPPASSTSPHGTLHCAHCTAHTALRTLH